MLLSLPTYVQQDDGLRLKVRLYPQETAHSNHSRSINFRRDAVSNSLTPRPHLGTPDKSASGNFNLTSMLSRGSPFLWPFLYAET